MVGEQNTITAFPQRDCVASRSSRSMKQPQSSTNSGTRNVLPWELNESMYSVNFLSGFTPLGCSRRIGAVSLILVPLKRRWLFQCVPVTYIYLRTVIISKNKGKLCQSFHRFPFYRLCRRAWMWLFVWHRISCWIG